MAKSNTGERTSGEIYLLDEVGVLGEGVAGPRYRAGEQHPGHQRRITEEGIGHVAGRNLGQRPEEQAENDHHEQGLDNRPGEAEYRLPVVYLDVAPDEKIEKFAVGPYLPEVDRHPSP